MEVEHYSNPPTSEICVSYYHKYAITVNLYFVIVPPFQNFNGGKGIAGFTGLPVDSHRVMKNEQ